MDPPFEKTPPKSEDQIRAALQSMRRDEDQEIAPGTWRNGLAPDTRLVIASFYTSDAARRFQETLLRAGIMSEGTFRRTGAEISVDYSDRQRAAELLDEHRLQFPDLPPTTHCRDFDFTIFGTLLGATFGVILLAAEFRGPRELAALVIFTVFGTITGTFLDRPRNRYRRTGQVQFGVGDLLVLTAVIALGIVLWRVLGGR